MRLALVMVLSCCASRPLDEAIEKRGRTVWGRTHFPLGPLEKMNKARLKKSRARIRRICAPNAFKITHQYEIDHRLVKLAANYPKPRRIVVLEFKCL